MQVLKANIMKKITKNLLVTGAVILSATAVWFLFIYKPRVSHLQKVEQEIKMFAHELKSVVAQESQIAGMKKQIAVTQEKIVAWEQRIYSKDRLPQILSDLENRGRGYGLKFSSIMPDYDALLSVDAEMRQSLGPLIILPVELQIQGAYKDFGRFVESFDDLPFAFSVRRAHIEITPESYPDLVMRLEGVVFLTEAPITDLN
jgi:Tfp pilus assembly protein PilO